MIGCAIRKFVKSSILKDLRCISRWVKIPYNSVQLLSEPAGGRMVIKRQKPGQDINVVKKLNGGPHRLS